MWNNIYQHSDVSVKKETSPYHPAIGDVRKIAGSWFIINKLKFEKNDVIITLKKI